MSLLGREFRVNVATSVDAKTAGKVVDVAPTELLVKWH